MFLHPFHHRIETRAGCWSPGRSACRVVVFVLVFSLLSVVEQAPLGSVGAPFFGISSAYSQAPAAIEEGYILLSNGNVLRGEVEPLGELMLVRRDGVDQLRLRASQVVGTGRSLQELYHQRASKRSTYDVKGTLEDARWCLRYGLHEELEMLLRHAESLDPTHPETVRLRRQWMVISQPADPNEPSRVQISDDPEPVERKASEEAEEAIDRELQAAGMPETALAYFSRQVQPLLISRCGNAGCHRGPRESGWELVHWGTHVRPPGRMTKQNLAATLHQLDRRDPGQSDLVRFALTPHGGRRDPPVKANDDPVLPALRHWVDSVGLWGTGSSLDSGTPLTALHALPPGALQVPPGALPVPLDRSPPSPQDVMAGRGHMVVLPEPLQNASGQPPADGLNDPAAESAVRQASHWDDLPVPPIGIPPVWPAQVGSNPASKTATGELRSPSMKQPFPTPVRYPQPSLGAGGSKATRLPPVDNPFDPEIFNRNYRHLNSPRPLR